MTDTLVGGCGRRPFGPLPRFATAVAAMAALFACDGGDMPEPFDPAPFVEGLEATGLTQVRYEGFRRDGGAYVLAGVRAATGDGQALSAREVRFEDVRSLRPLTAGRLVVADLDAGQARAGKVEVPDFRSDAPPGAGRPFAVERFEGRFAGQPFKARSLARDGGSFRFAGLEHDAPLLSARKDWEGTAEPGKPGRSGATVYTLSVSAGETRLGLQVTMDGPVPGTERGGLSSWPFRDVAARWDMAPVRGLEFRSEGMVAGIRPQAVPGGQASMVFDGLAKGFPVAVAYQAASPVPLGVAWMTFLSSPGPVPGLAVRVGEGEAASR